MTIELLIGFAIGYIPCELIFLYWVLDNQLDALSVVDNFGMWSSILLRTNFHSASSTHWRFRHGSLNRYRVIPHN